MPCATMMETSIEENALNILDHDLKDIINSSYLYETGSLKAKDFLENNQKCRECRYSHLCLGGCRARALFLQNDIFGNDTDVCTYFLDGYKERKDELLKRLNVKTV